MRLFSKTPSVALPETGTSQLITSPRIDKISMALARAQGTVQAAVRTQTAENEPDKFDYADLDDIINAMQSAADDNDLAVIERFPEGKKSLHCILVHGSGQWIDYGSYEFGTPATHREKGSAITYGRKAMHRCIFGIADRDFADDDGAMAGKITHVKEGEMIVPAAQGFTPHDPLRPHKNALAITVPVLPDGTLNFDHFAAEMENEISMQKTMEMLSLLNRANSRTLDIMEKERPDLFKTISEAFNKKDQQLM